MAEHFYDTSAVVKHYQAELGTPYVDTLLADTGSHHFLSALSIVELHSALAQLVRMGQMTDAEFHTVRGQFFADIAPGLWQIVAVTAADFQQAQQLLVKYGLGRSFRTLDAIQLAVAINLHAASPLDDFVSADANLNLVAAAEGLTVLNPVAPPTTP